MKRFKNTIANLDTDFGSTFWAAYTFVFTPLMLLGAIYVGMWIDS